MAYAVPLADPPDTGSDLTQTIGRQAGEQVMLDLLVEATAEDGQPRGHFDVAGAFGLHHVPLRSPRRAGALWVVRRADVAAADDRGRAEIASDFVGSEQSKA